MAAEQQEVAGEKLIVKDASQFTTLIVRKSTKSSLETLPNEVLDSILKVLAIPPPAVGSTRRRDLFNLKKNTSWTDFLLCRQGLRNLCLTSKSFSESQTTRAMLYRHIAFVNPVGLVLLFRTIIEQPGYAVHVRVLSCHFNLTVFPIQTAAWKATKRLLPTFNLELLAASKSQASYILSDSLKVSKNHTTIPQVILFGILEHAQKLTELHLQLTTCFAGNEIIEPESEVFLGLLADAYKATSSSKFMPCKNLARLVLHGHPEDHCIPASERPDNLFSAFGCKTDHYWPLYALAPKLKTLEIENSNAAWNRPSFERMLVGNLLGNVKHLNLRRSAYTPRDLYLILKETSGLETLYFSAREVVDSEDWFVRENHPFTMSNEDPYYQPTLDWALSEHGKSLKRLSLSWIEVEFQEFGVNETVGMLGPDNFVDLGEMPKLEFLNIQVVMFYADQDMIECSGLAKKLPSSLIELCLVDWWWSDSRLYSPQSGEYIGNEVQLSFENQASYRQDMRQLLIDLAEEAAERLPTLSKVSFVIKVKARWILGEQTVESHFTEVRKAMDEARIKFEVLVDEYQPTKFDLGE